MNIYLLVLRLVHVVAAIVWGGGALIMEFFIGGALQVQVNRVRNSHNTS
jgi:uncharacterized membrane protein